MTKPRVDSQNVMSRFHDQSPFPDLGRDPDKTSWRADEHERYDSPAVLVIPAHVIHTTQDVGEGTTWLIDAFGPPRLDFSSKPGFVLNARDYPMPAGM